MTSEPIFGTKTKAAEAGRGPGAGASKVGALAGPHVAADAEQQYTVIVALRGMAPDADFLMVDHKSRGWELPGGKLEAMEGPVHCALREFREETGHLLSSPRFVAKLHKANGTCYVFTGGLGVKVDDVDGADAVAGMKWFRRLPRDERLAFPDDPYDEIGKLLGIQFG